MNDVHEDEGLSTGERVGILVVVAILGIVGWFSYDFVIRVFTWGFAMVIVLSGIVADDGGLGDC